MKKTFFLLFSLGLLAISPLAFGQGMMGQGQYLNNAPINIDTASTAQDEAKGKAIWDKLQSKQADCKSLVDDDYDVLGDYFMGLMAGNGHASMNTRMAQMMGEQGEKEMHIVMGKRLSGCDINASISPQYETFLPWANMMGNYNNGAFPMMSGINGRNYFENNTIRGNLSFSAMHIIAMVTLVLFWITLALTIVALIHYIRTPRKK